MFEYIINHWVKITFEAISFASVAGAVLTIVPPITAIIGLIYWSRMLYLSFKKKE